MHRLSLLLSFGLLALPAGCSDSPPGDGGTSAKAVSALLDDASAAMDAQDWKKAIATLDAALADGRATAEERVQAWQDKVLCEAQAHGDEAASAALKALVASGVEMTPDQFAKLGNDLAAADKLTAAVDVIDVATRKFAGDDAVKKKLERLARGLSKKLQASGDQASLDRLSSLGYLGTTTDEDE